jgi:YD repeat-containing protein
VLLRPFFLVSAVILACVSDLNAQAQDASAGGIKRVTVSQNNDGSRTTYEIDTAARKEVATTTSADGKVQSKILYELDDSGRFATGQVFGPGDQFRFKTTYKYDPAGRLAEETQLTKNDVVRGKLVYAYDQLTGRQTGYAAYDAAGKLVGQTHTNGSGSSPATTPAASPQKHR